MTPATRNALTAEESARFTELRAIVRKGMASFLETAQALLEISDKRFYRGEYSTFKEFCEAEYNLSASQVYRYCEAAEVIRSLPESVAHGRQINERQARELSKAPAEKRAQVLEAAQDKAESKGKPVTAADIKEAALEVCPPAEPPAPDPEPPKTQDDAWRKAIGISDADNFFASQIEDIVTAAIADGSPAQLKAIRKQWSTWGKKIENAVKQKSL